MNIMICLDSDLRSEAVCRFLTMNGYDVVESARAPGDGLAPQVLLVDITTLTYDLLAQYPHAKTFLIDDIGVEAEKLCAALGSYKTGGILTPRAGLRQVWVDNGSVKALRHDAGAIPITTRPKGKRRSSSAFAKGRAVRRSPGDLRRQATR